jgi:hypothetical protein
MKIRNIFYILLISALIACSPQKNEEPIVSVSEPVSQEQDIPVQVSETADTEDTAILPTPGEVIYAITNEKGDGSGAYEVANGSWAHFWYGQSYKINGVFYYTAFIYQTPDFYGKPEEREEPAPGAQATIAQATFKRAALGAQRPWDFVGAEPYIGKFGSYEKGDDVDETRQVIAFGANSENYFWAVPTQSLAGGGVAVSAYEIFQRNQEGRWKYAGYIFSGEDNSAGCADSADSGLPVCIVSIGQLTFVSKSGMPEIQVKMSGTTVDAPGKVRILGEQDTHIYRYEQKSGHYQLVK